MIGEEGEVSDRRYDEISAPQPSTPLGAAEVLFPKIEDSVIEEEIRLLHERASVKASEAPRVDADRSHPTLKGAAMDPTPLSSPAPAPQPAAGALPPLKPEIDYEKFAALDLRVGKVLEAEPVPKSRSLLRLRVDLGFETRQVLAGISQQYRAEDLIGRQVIVLANLKPRKMMGLESQGMVLAAHLGEAPVVLVPEKEATIGGAVT
jgi:methionyl-tRNA synthetase